MKQCTEHPRTYHRELLSNQTLVIAVKGTSAVQSLLWEASLMEMFQGEITTMSTANTLIRSLQKDDPPQEAFSN